MKYIDVVVMQIKMAEVNIHIVIPAQVVGEYLEITQTDPDEEAIKSAYLEVDKILMEEVPMFALYFCSNMGAVNNRIENANPTFYGTFNNIQEWDIA